MKVFLHNPSPGRTEIRSPKAEGRKKSECRSPNFSALDQVNHEPTELGSNFGFRISAFLRPSAFGFRPSRRRERGIALVVTLLMLSVITFMAIAFLVLSRGERTSTATATDQTLARLAANNALERAQAELVVPMIASTNFASGGLMVSTNYINQIGFIRSGNPQVSANATNVAYNYANGAPLSFADGLQNLANLEINPRPPVFIVTNRLTGSNDFRYYLDLNRNGAFEPSGWVGVTNVSGISIGVDYVQGDPQWIGGLEFPDRRHSADNRFIYRYAYLVVPISQALDINYIHNAAGNPLAPRINLTGADYLRNQGVGTWEINLAAFLYDLNTNTYAWGPKPGYNPLVANGVGGNAYVDAAYILANRYGGINSSYPSALQSVASMFPTNGQRAFRSHSVDGYTAGPIMTTASGFNFDPDVYRGDRTLRPWPGADNTNHFFSTQDLFDPNKTSQNFASRLLSLGTHVDTYDRYTFYRLLSQLGTDSAPEPAGKINLNYDNKVQANAQGIVSATNFIPWKPADFFTTTANALLANAGFTNMSVTNLIIYPFNFYTPAVHHFLQLAANIYDASGATNRAAAANPQYVFPTVFRPIFRRVTTPTNVLVEIVGYREVVNANIANSRVAPIMVELDNPASPNGGPGKIPVGPWNPNDINDKNEPMVSGIPLIIGAKKNFPNFNELAMQTEVFVSRLLEFRRDQPNGPVMHTNQMYVLDVTNSFGLEAWNSYFTNYPRQLQLQATMLMTAIITNEHGGAFNLVFSNRVGAAALQTIPAGTWRGWTDPKLAPYSMILPFVNTNGFVWTNATAINQYPWIEPQTHLFPPAFGLGRFYVPHWWLNLNTRLQFTIVDTSANRIVDYVNINNWERTVDITTNLLLGASSQLNDYKNPANEWITNRFGSNPNDANAPTWGVMNQIQVGLNGTTDWQSYSHDPYSGLDAESAVDGFRFNLLGESPLYPKDSGKVFTKTNVFYAPFDPYRPMFIHTTWQANDPLVHYTAGDLIDTSFNSTNVDFQSQVPPLNNLGKINTRYRPWGGNPASQDPMTDYEMAVKDPFVTRSDDWDFPTNKFPNIGWLGRVHRGTPWQTVFLKSTNFLQKIPVPKNVFLINNRNMMNWQNWSGNPFVDYNFVTNGFPPHIQTNLVGANLFVPDAIFSAPTNDWRILDLFSTAFNDNAGRGQLSINQPNLAAWSAVLSGVNVLSNSSTFVTNVFIQPAGPYNTNPVTGPLPPLVTIVNGINNARTNFANKAFSRLGDVLATPELTMASPYLNPPSAKTPINDAVVERIPQQILGLLHGGEQPPRFVIYSYGQALKPAVHSLYQGAVGGGAYFGLCTNYQITAEVATRAVVRIEGAPGKPRTVIENFTVLPPD